MTILRIALILTVLVIHASGAGVPKIENNWATTNTSPTVTNIVKSLATNVVTQNTSASALTNFDTRAISLTNAANQFAGIFTNKGGTVSQYATHDANGKIVGTLNGSGWTNIGASSVSSVYASNVTSGGVLPAGTVSASTPSAGQILVNDGTLRQWTNRASIATIDGPTLFPLANNAATGTPGIDLTNTTTATAGNPKASPLITLHGNGFGTTGSTNGPVHFSIGVVPTSAATAAGNLVISNALGSAAPTDVLRLGQTGNLTAGGSVNSGGAMNANGGAVSVTASFGFLVTGRAYMNSSVNGSVAFTDGQTVQGVTNITMGFGTTNVSLRTDGAATPTLTVLAASGTGGAHLAVNGLFSLQPLGSTQTNSANLGIWNSNNFALYVRNTNGVDKLLIAIP